MLKPTIRLCHNRHGAIGVSDSEVIEKKDGVTLYNGILVNLYIAKILTAAKKYTMSSRKQNAETDVSRKLVRMTSSKFKKQNIRNF